MTTNVIAKVLELKELPTKALKARWVELFGSAPPPYNRRFLESRLAYRIQELSFGGLKPETRARLDQLADQIDREVKAIGRSRAFPDLPPIGTRLIKEWQGYEHTVTVRQDGFEYLGRPYKSLSAIAKAITGTHWNGRAFFGLARGSASAGRRKRKAG